MPRTPRRTRLQFEANMILKVIENTILFGSKCDSVCEFKFDAKHNSEHNSELPQTNRSTINDTRSVSSLVLSLGHGLHIAADRVHDDTALLLFRLLRMTPRSLPYNKLILRKTVLLVLDIISLHHPHIFVHLGSLLAVVGIGRGVLVRLPHHHETQKQDEVIHGPDAVVHSTSHAAPAPYNH